ncbi:MAG: hypothetical protein M1826_003502 [Phylliscum demangeonii]|nr:MAG: hypothetical protein M1826_003502 [Phylliscum demangeonii]
MSPPDPTANPNASSHIFSSGSTSTSTAAAAATTASGAIVHALSSMLRTPGVANIEAAYTRGGGTATGLPALGTTRTTGGDQGQGQVVPRKGVESQAVGSESFEGSIADQKPEPGVLAKAFNTMTYGSTGGK